MEKIGTSKAGFIEIYNKHIAWYGMYQDGAQLYICEPSFVSIPLNKITKILDTLSWFEIYTNEVCFMVAKNYKDLCIKFINRF